ncbi:MAG: hypothetical protein V4661_10955 [Pseudomonadota bacterium]
MSLLSHAGSSGTVASRYRRAVAILMRRAGRLVDNWVAALIAHRERQVAGSMLRRYGDRESNDTGICRGEIDFKLSETNRS